MILAFLHLATLAGADPLIRDAVGCASSTKDEVVVCGSRPGLSPFRLPKLPDRYDATQIRAEADIIPGVHTRAHVDSMTMPDGNRSNRLMVTFSLPF